MGYYARYLFPLSPFHKTRDTPGRVKQGGSKKSFGISSWHLLRKGEKYNERKAGKKILGSMTIEGRGAFFGKGCCENARVPSGKEKEDWKEFFQKLDAKYFCQRKLFWDTPVYHM